MFSTPKRPPQNAPWLCLLKLIPSLSCEIADDASVPQGIRLYFDYGTGTSDSVIGPEQDKVTAWLRSQGLKEGEDFVVRQFPGAKHTEAAWRARLDEPLIFLFRPRTK